MKKLILLLLVLAVAGAAYYFYEKKQKEEARDNLLLYGNVDIRQVDLGFQVAGRVVKMYFEEGDTVQPGALLGKLDKRPYTDQERESHANLQSIKVNLQNAEKTFKRRLELIKDGSVSQEDFDNANAAYEALKASQQQAEASLALAQTNLSYTEVYAPTLGTILTRVREPGTVVNVGDPIYTLSVASPVWVRAYVSEPDLGKIFPGMEAEIFTDNSNGKVYSGKIGFISPVAEFTPKTVETTQLRTDLVYRIRIYADNPDHGLRQGMPVTVKLNLRQQEPEQERK